ncbi:pentatricopeptide repeat-containing protein At4g17616 [Malania oleifera]|uniref:pentatricopeptide repeat-containing protein At4g17616 n=1 Tax=Malania oleifera TaxID=397392 RepID=UPI0025AE8D13|nr:pentatricopeptide repeat-containing protein At4g17616 [Malania oleifera]XP_057978242.1 pentatricopeptide repeat-containing protein At4g17616 [Malania oleifera]XP_057978243.1 pentatricopeptide repeat-containing protein At4g17616 [Malania oleifera]
MALLLTKERLLHSHFMKICSSALRTISGSLFVPSNEIFRRASQVSDPSRKQYHNPLRQNFPTCIPPGKLSREGSSCGVLLRKLEIALKDHQVDEAWEVFNDYKSLYGFPNRPLVGRLITELSYSSNHQWLRKASDLVFFISKEKRSDLLQLDFLTKLFLSLARAQMPIPATRILWLMLEKHCLPPVSVLSLAVLHMVKTEIGSHLVSNFLVETCNSFQCPGAEKSNPAKLVKLDTMIFNLVLDACVRFGLSFKGQQIIELMAQERVVADAHSIVIIAQIHEMNGLRDEVKKFKDHIDRVSVPFVRHYRQFYDSLLSLHFKFNDVDAASGLVLDLYRCREPLPVQNDRKDSCKPCFVPIGSQYLREGLKIEIAAELLQKDSVLNVKSKQELIMFKNGKFVLTNRALAKFINMYKSSRRISELSKLILAIQKALYSLEEASLCSDVINACICLGWLETAHDILDDMESERAFMGYTTYMSLLKAYCRAKMFRQAKALLKQMRKVGFVINLSDEMVISTCLSEVLDKGIPCVKASASKGKLELAEFVLLEVQEEHRKMPPVVYELNSSIYFFCKARMIEDALKTYRRMQDAKIQPTVQTFANLVYGYSSWKMYREITILWGDIKRNLQSGTSVVNRDLYEFLLLNFLRGGYFERVMEIIDYMHERSMYPDKCKYKNEFLKFHKDLYRNLKAIKARTEAQGKRIEHVKAFRKWVGIG